MSILYLGVRKMSAGKAIRLLSYVQAMSFVQSIWSLDMSAAKMDTNSEGCPILSTRFYRIK